MGNRLKLTMISVGAAAFVAALWLAAIPTEGQAQGAAAQFPPYKGSRMADGKPNLNGIWQAHAVLPATRLAKCRSQSGQAQLLNTGDGFVLLAQ